MHHIFSLPASGLLSSTGWRNRQGSSRRGFRISGPNFNFGSLTDDVFCQVQLAAPRGQYRMYRLLRPIVALLGSSRCLTIGDNPLYGRPHLSSETPKNASPSFLRTLPNNDIVRTFQTLALGEYGTSWHSATHDEAYGSDSFGALGLTSLPITE